MEADFDEAAGHSHFSVAAFNATWSVLDKPGRSSLETEEMIHAAHASMWHWLKRPDVDPEKRSIGYWLLSRVHAEAGQGERALHYGGLALEEAEGAGLGPFYLGYALEAVMRACFLLGRRPEAHAYQTRARQEAVRIEDEETRHLLEADLAEFG